MDSKWISRSHTNILEVCFAISKVLFVVFYRFQYNLISWNDKEPKYDLRDWDSEHKKMVKGVTLTAEELKKLRDVLNGMDL